MQCSMDRSVTAACTSQRLGDCTAVGWHAAPCQRPRCGRRRMRLACTAAPAGTSIAQRRGSSVEHLERSLEVGGATGEHSAEAAARSAEPASTSGSKRLVDQGEVFHSTWTHRAWVWGATALLGATFLRGCAKVHDPAAALAAAAAAVAAYYVADFLTGVYHWSVDNYGSGATPIVGSQIAAFQGHHQRPWTITEREFCNNVHKVFMPATPFAALCLAATPWTAAPADVFLATATLLVCMSQQFHAWAHMKKSQLPAAVNALQNAGVLVSRRVHGTHHRAPFEGNYCIVSGVWNGALDAGGSDGGFFRRAERLVAALTGVEPRCWYPPDYSWQEEEDGVVHEGRAPVAQ